jgi:probable HAF family extracellular repeat protein
VLAYEVTELTPPPEALTPDGLTDAKAVNSNGAAAGSAWQNNQADGEAVLWRKPDAPQVIEPIPPGEWGLGINDRGDVVGVLDVPNPALNRKGKPSAFIFHRKSGNLQNLAPIVGGEASLAFDISDDAVVVGYAGESWWLRGFSATGHGFIYDSKNDRLTEIDPLPGHVNATAGAINEPGHVVGISAPAGQPASDMHLFIHRDGATEDLGLAYNVQDINDADVITGERAVVSHQVPQPSAFRYDAAAANPSFEDLNATLPWGFLASHGAGINNDGAIVGWAYTANVEAHAMIHNPDGPDAGWTDLNDTLVNKDGWHLEYAQGMSHSGHIVGTGRHHGLRRAFLLRPHAPHLELVAQAIWVLIAIIGGSTVGAPGGIGITGGGNPVPIDPQGFATLWRDLSAHERDSYIGVAMRKLGGIVADPETRAEVERVATRLMESGTREVGGG